MGTHLHNGPKTAQPEPHASSEVTVTPETAGKERSQAARASLDPKEMVGLAAAATTLITVVSGLAVTGALQQFQRNHGVWLMLAFVLVLVAAGIWAIAATRPKQTTRWTLTAVAVFLIGLLTGIAGMVVTQWDVKVPSITASIDEHNVLTATAVAYNLGTNDRMMTRVAFMAWTRETTPNGPQTVCEVQPPKYTSVSGPDAGGTVTQSLKYALAIPAGSCGLIVEAAIGHVPVCFGQTIFSGPRKNVADSRTACIVMDTK